MADARFYKSAGPFSSAHLAEITGATLERRAPRDAYFNDINSLQKASQRHVSFIANKQYLKDFRNSLAGAVFLKKDLIDQSPKGTINLISDDPYLAYAKAAKAFYPSINSYIPQKSESHLISDTAQFGSDVYISPGAVVMERAEIGAGSMVGPNSVIGPGVIVGKNSYIAANCTLFFCYIGQNAIIHSGVRIGQDGYGFVPNASGHFKIPQLGRVMIGDDVEIGANTCIDRGSLADTVIGNRTKLDNLIQIAHNVSIGEGCIITAQVGIAGSTEIGNYVMLGGQAGISGHLSIGDKVKVAAQAGVTKDVEPGQTIAGYPAMNTRKFWRNMATLNKLSEKNRSR